MNRSIKAAALALAAASLVSTGFAQDARVAQQQVKLRQAVYTVLGTHFSQMGAMVQGRMPYDAATFRTAAERVAFIVGGNTSLVDYFLGSGPALEATVELQQDPSTPSGYAWSIGQGPDVEIQAGTLSEVTVVVRDTPVIGWFTQ